MRLTRAISTMSTPSPTCPSAAGNASSNSVSLTGNSSLFPPCRNPATLQSKPLPAWSGRGRRSKSYSTVTDFARLRGWSTSQPRSTAMARANSCSGTLAVTAENASRTFGM